MLREKCVEGITANEDVAMGMVTNSIGIVTALLPFIGYANASEAAKVALATEAARAVADVLHRRVAHRTVAWWLDCGRRVPSKEGVARRRGSSGRERGGGAHGKRENDGSELHRDVF